MPFTLISTEGEMSFELRAGSPMVVGRAFSSDIPLFDPTISRRHAELECDVTGLRVRDLGSSNGTYLNGNRVDAARASAGDLLTFGKVAFRVNEISVKEARALTPAEMTAIPAAEPMIVRQRPVADSGQLLQTALDHRNINKPSGTHLGERTRNEKKLALLLEVAKGLSRAVDIDVILDQIVGFVFQIMDVDRVALMLCDEHGAMMPKIARDREGTLPGRIVPQSISRQVVDAKVAVLSDNAPEDARFGGQSIVQQRVRSAMCAPLIGSETHVQGVLYVDNLTATHRFGDDDLDFLIAFSGIAAVAIENSRFSERIRREMLVRSNFERYFAPSLAARIAGASGEVRLGGDKRRVAVLFSDIRGFTSLSETMTPDEVATLLSEYFTVMVDCVFKHGGTLDKFIGDAIMAQWGAPLAAPDDADRAMDAALDMMRQLDTLNDSWREAGRPTLQIGIGLNVGDVFAGNIGSERRLEFTVIGDAVNTAAHLCAAAEGGEILLTEAMRDALHQPPIFRERAPIEHKGKSHTLAVASVMT